MSQLNVVFALILLFLLQLLQIFMLRRQIVTQCYLNSQDPHQISCNKIPGYLKYIGTAIYFKLVRLADYHWLLDGSIAYYGSLLCYLC